MTLEERIQQQLGSYIVQIAALAVELEKAQVRIKELESEKKELLGTQ